MKASCQIINKQHIQFWQVTVFCASAAEWVRSPPRAGEEDPRDAVRAEPIRRQRRAPQQSDPRSGY